VSAKPRYQQLKDLIIDRIATGELRPSDRVPSEHELVEAMNVSRMTANRALRELHDEGYVDRIAGRGTYVSDFRSQSHLVAVQNIADEIAGRGHSHSCRVLRQSRQRARGEVAKALHVEQGTDVFHLLLVHAENGAPVQVEDRHILASFAPECLEQDFATTTPSAYLTSVAPLQEAEQVVRASMPNPAIRKSLAMDEGEPTLVIVRRTWSNGQPVTFGRFHHPGSRYELTGHYAPPGTERSMPTDVAQLETIEQ
jgi:GntR family transcriptional regulator, histidine utilization repressor